MGSTLAFAEHGDVYVAAVRRVQALVAEYAEGFDGVVVNTAGDGAFLAFPSAHAAVQALRQLQDTIELGGVDAVRLRVRAGAHAGDAVPVAQDYLALPVHVAARVAAAAGPGQVLVSQSVIDELGEPTGEKLGPFLLKDIADPVTLWRVAGDRAAPRAVPPRHTNVATPRTSFVGRESELENLARLFSEPALVTVVGPGGLGKTRLVTQFAIDSADGFAAGVWMIELASIANEPEIVPIVGNLFGIPASAALDAVTREIARRGEMVLIFDNCEHVLDGVAEVVATLSAECPMLRVLCTSREPLAVDGEEVVRLATLSTAAAPTIGVASATRSGAAEQLFIRRAVSAGAAIEALDTSAVTDLCRRLDGLPLALELAAVHAGATPIPDLVIALSEGDVELRRRGGPERLRSLDALVSWSTNLLTDPERRGLHALSVLPGRFTARTAQQLLTAVAEGSTEVTADSLARRSLLDLDGSEYRMLIPVRDVVRRQLDEQSTRTAMAALLTWASETCAPRGQIEMLDDEVRALESALDWAISNNIPGGGRIMQQLANRLKATGVTPTALDLAARCLRAGEPHTIDEIHLQLGALRLQVGLGTAANPTFLKRAGALVDAARLAGESHALRIACSLLAVLLDRAGRHSEAHTLYRETLVLIEENQNPDSPQERTRVLCDLAVSYHLQGDLQSAEQQYRHAISTASPTDVNALVLMINLGELLLDLGRPEEAAAHLSTTLQSARGRPALSAITVALLAEAEAKRGALDEARALADQAEREFADIMSQDPSTAYVRDRMRSTLEHHVTDVSNAIGTSGPEAVRD
ncbi:MAG: tetratricopeptide repeat protein [Actinomycetota bacterium]|nr:tetratricopeptide repeat protein [Actinomycetota bacterium]